MFLVLAHRARRATPAGPAAGSVARVRRITVLLTLAGALAAVAPAAARAETRLPDLGDAAGETLSRAEEQRLGEAFLRQVRTHLRLVDDPEIADYVDSLGQRIASADSKRSYRFLTIDTPAANAFAGPGGIIAVNTGLVMITKSESELASVLAHEIAHVSQRHLARIIERSQASSLTTLATILGAIVIATQNTEAGQAAITASVAGAQQSALEYSRENEMEADRIGMVLLHRAGFDPRAMPAFFERFQDWQRFASKPPAFLSTHPVTLSRISDTQGRAEQFPRRTYRDSAEYSLIRSKVRLRMASSPAEALEYFESRAAAGEASEADRYGLALALMAVNRPEEASTLLEALRKEFPERAAHRVAAAQAHTALGETARALDLLAESFARFPDYRALAHGYGLALIQAGRPDEAAALLRKFQRKHDSDAAVYRLLGLAHQRAGRPAASHIALAEFYIQSGNLEAAVRQLDIALKEPSIDEYESARAQARREELRSELRKLRSRS